MGRSKALNDKNQIVEAGISIIDNEGEEALSIRRLSSTLGVSSMTIYNYLENIDEVKREILIACYNKLNRQILKILDSNFYPDSEHVERYILAYATVYFNNCSEHSALIRFILNDNMSQHRNDPELRHFTQPLGVFYRNEKEWKRKTGFIMIEQLIQTMLLNHAKGTYILDREELLKRVQFLYHSFFR